MYVKDTIKKMGHLVQIDLVLFTVLLFGVPSS